MRRMFLLLRWTSMVRSGYPSGAHGSEYLERDFRRWQDCRNRGYCTRENSVDFVEFDILDLTRRRAYESVDEITCHFLFD